MILAAGRGKRLDPLTATTPKALIEVGGMPLIERHLRRLRAAGITECVINLAHLGHLIEERLGGGAELGVSIRYSREAEGALETGGAIAAALPLLGREPFLVLNADIWTDFAFPPQPPAGARAHLVVVPNPPHHAHGDFDLHEGRLYHAAQNTYTYAGIGVFAPELFAGRTGERFALAPVLFALAARGELSGEVHAGRWFDIGTAERLAHARSAAG